MSVGRWCILLNLVVPRSPNIFVDWSSKRSGAVNGEEEGLVRSVGN